MPKKKISGGYCGTRKEHQAAGVGFAARLVIHDAEHMTKRGRKDIANWLRKHADQLIEKGEHYERRFRATYFYDEVNHGKKA